MGGGSGFGGSGGPSGPAGPGGGYGGGRGADDPWATDAADGGFTDEPPF
jgi:single-strand DNA-binding protein